MLCCYLIIFIIHAHPARALPRRSCKQTRKTDHMRKLIAAPGAEPVTLAEAKLHARVETAADDTLISAMISAAREEAEHILGRALITQTWEMVLPAFADNMELPHSIQ